MPRAALDPVDIQAFRESLCTAAERRFAELGYAGVTMRGLASDLGCSAMTPYRYFENKAAIFSAVRCAAFARFAESQEIAFAAHEGALERLDAIGAAYVAFAKREPNAYRIMFELDQPPDPDNEELAQEATRAWLPLRKGVEAAIDAGVLAGDPKILAHLFWASVHGLVALDLVDKFQEDVRLEALVAPMNRTLIEGNRPTEDPHDA